MRRKEKEVKDIEEVEAIIERATVCRLGLSVDNVPYIVPLNFGYKDRCLYFHSAREGRKIDMIKSNDNVCFEVEADTELIRADNPCEWGMKYRSVIGFGKASIVEDPEERKRGLDVIMAHYSSERSCEYPPSAFEKAAIIKVRTEHMTGKRSG